MAVNKRSAFRKRLLICGALLGIVCVVLVAAFIYRPWAQKQQYPLEYASYINAYAAQYDLDAAMVAAMIRVESSYRPAVVSSMGAVGLMQIKPDTAQWLSEKFAIEGYSEEALTQPAMNIQLGCVYMRFLLDTFITEREALTAYNAGQGRVREWLNDPEYSKDGKTLSFIPGRDAAQYADKVLAAREEYKKLYAQQLSGVGA